MSDRQVACLCLTGFFAGIALTCFVASYDRPEDRSIRIHFKLGALQTAAAMAEDLDGERSLLAIKSLSEKFETNVPGHVAADLDSIKTRRATRNEEISRLQAELWSAEREYYERLNSWRWRIGGGSGSVVCAVACLVGFLSPHRREATVAARRATRLRLR
jgi:hypothetical protein